MPLLETLRALFEMLEASSVKVTGPSRGRDNLKEQFPRQELGKLVLWASGCCEMPRFCVMFVSAPGARAHQEKIQGFPGEEIQKNQCFYHFCLLIVVLREEDEPVLLRSLF